MIKRTFSEYLKFHSQKRWFANVHSIWDVKYIIEFIKLAFVKEIYFQLLYTKRNDIHYEEILIQIYFDYEGTGINKKEIEKIRVK